jgi:hypothetical protein
MTYHFIEIQQVVEILSKDEIDKILPNLLNSSSPNLQKLTNFLVSRRDHRAMVWR